MMSLKLVAKSASDGAYNLLRSIQKQIDKSGSYDGTLAILEQTATGKETSNPFMAVSLDLSRLATTLNRLERFYQTGIYNHTTTHQALGHFCQSFMQIFGPEYLRKPTVTDVEKEQYVRRDHGSNPFILLEAVASQHLWTWHAFFGVAGSNNDINILYQFPLFNDLKTGRALEIPFVASSVTYPWGYYLVDEIYPELATLTKTISEPADDDHKRILYKLKQEFARKDVLNGLELLVRLDLQAVYGLNLVLNKVVEMISCTSKSKLLSLPWERTPRLDSSVRVRKHVVRGESSTRFSLYFDYNRSGQSGTLVGQGSTVIVTADADYLPRTLTNPLLVCGSVGPMPRDGMDQTQRPVIPIIRHQVPPIYSIFDVRSTLTQTALDAFCQKYHITDAVHPELLALNQSIHDSPAGKIGVYTRFFEFADFCIPLSQFLVDVLGYLRINLSQLSVITASKVSHFEILCCVHDYVPTVRLFRRFYVNSKNKGWMSFSKRSDSAPVCYTKPLDSLKHWNDSFFWVDASIFPLSVPWHTKKTVTRDPSPTANEFSAEASDFLATQQAPFRKFSESFLCLVGISRYYDIMFILPFLLIPKRVGALYLYSFICFSTTASNCFLLFVYTKIDLFSFIRHADPMKVRIGERQFEEGQVSLLESTRGHVASLSVGGDQAGSSVPAGHGNDNVGTHDLNKDGGGAEVGDPTEESDHVDQDEEVNIVADKGVQAAVADKPKKVRKKRKAASGASGSNLPPKKLREDHDPSGDVSASIAGKSLAALQGLLEQSTLAVKVGVTAAATVPFVTSSVTPTPEREGGGHTDSFSGPNLRIKHPVERFIISSESSHHSSTNAVDDEVTSIVKSSMPPPPVMTAAVATTAIVGVTSAPTYVPKWNVINDSALDDPEVCQSMVDQLSPPRLFSQLQGMDYEQSFAEFNVGVASQTCFSAEVRLRHEHNYRERNKFERKCNRQADLLKEKDVEISNLKAQLSLKEAEAAEGCYLFDELSIKVSSLESQKDNLADQIVKTHIKEVQDAQVKVLSDRVARLDAELMGMALHLDKEFYPRFLTTIAGQRWIISRGLRLTAGRGLTEVVAYDPSVEGKYVFAVLALRNLEFTLISQLESQKDASIADIISLLHLEGPSVKTPEGIRLQPSYEQLLLPIHRMEDNVVIGETSLSDSLDVVQARVWKIKEGASSRHLSISDVIGPLVDPLSSENLVGEASTSGVPTTVVVTTALSTTFAYSSSIPPISVSDYDVLDAKPQPEASHSPKIIFEQETLETSPEHPATN
ncbi:gypsy type transposase [Tanacetum coccineum]